MVKLILVLALLQYLYNFIFGYKSNVLSCGIFGQATDKASNLDVNGVHILGIYNIERGKMSCGLSWDGDVHYGLGFDKLYSDFIKNREIKPTKTPIMIGHTRQPSYGFAVTSDNSHPFGFGENKAKDSYAMIFCHNGTLKNHKELAQKYNIEITEEVTKVSSTNHTYTTKRDKIDSEILGEILYKTKSFDVLGEYIGMAALAWTWLDEPNKLYLWSGASKHTQGSYVKTEIEERPMNVYCKDKNNMFFSSLKDSLTVLGASSKKDLQIDYNTVYVITDGDFENAEKFPISRLNAGQNENTNYNFNNSRNFNRYNNSDDMFDYCDWEDHRSNSKVNNNHTEYNFSLTNLHDDKTIKTIAEYKDKVYSKSLRYWQKGILINGVYIYIKNWGFKYAGIDLEGAITYINNIKGVVFEQSSGTFNHHIKDGFTPFSKDIKSVQFHYFTDGVLLKNIKDYKQCLTLKKDLVAPAKYISEDILSYMSKHPVISMDPNKPSIALLNNEKFSGNITELGFEKIYYFNNGVLLKWCTRKDLKDNKPIQIPIALPQTTSKKIEPDVTFNNKILQDSIESIEAFEKDKTLETHEEFIDEESDEEFINELIKETFEKHSEDVENTILEFNDWKDNENVKDALNTLSLINNSFKDFLNFDKK